MSDTKTIYIGTSRATVDISLVSGVPGVHTHSWSEMTGIANSIPFDTTPVAVSTTEGTISWNTTDHTMNIQTDIADTSFQVGLELAVRCVNKTGSTIPNGSVVYISGAQGNRPTIALADADLASAEKTIGVVTSSISNNAEGYVTTNGLVRGIDTSSFSTGDILYLSQIAGQLTNVRPISPASVIRVAEAQNSTNNGMVLVNVSCDHGVTIDFTIGTGDSVPTTGIKGVYRIPQGCAVAGWSVTGDEVGSAVIDVLLSGTSMIGSGNKPTLSTQQSNTAVASGWNTTSLSVGDIITINVESIGTCKLVSLQLNIDRQ